MDAEPELASQFEVAALPCLVVLENGTEINRMIGLVSKKKILKMLGV